ncbi:MAG TPA: M20/M25/M40 family metallo-hydrolase [Verrucomicrobiae bacterium]|nr:M20/M25/M40 family metallo-hydrolase [Verrucomicrobiae bacterium]
MNPKTLSTIASRLLRHPVSPYHETAVRAEVEKICDEHRLAYKRDPFGNVIVRLQTISKQRPFVLAAHMDHPGFEIVRSLPNNRWLARFLGGVGDSYFCEGIPVRLMPGATPAKLGKRVGKEKQFELHALQTPDEPPQFAVWELEDFALRNGIIHARACDDLIGVATILATIIELKRTRARVNVIGVISRAEEVGFQGALTVAESRQLPKSSLIISLETSRELPPAVMGRGVVLRVGDRTSIFDSDAMRFLAEVAGDLRRRDKSFQFQRALMYGGTCEATAYQEFGFQTAAVCVALGNYHNCAPNDKIAAEYVSLADACGMAQLLVTAAKQMKDFERLVARLPARLQKLLKEARKKL